MAMEKVVSFHITGPYIHEVLPIIFDNSFLGQYKVPLYYKTSKQLLSLDSITAIILPAYINDDFPRNDYSPVELVKRIRLLSDEKKSQLPIFIPNGRNGDFSEYLLAGVYFEDYSPRKPGVKKLDYDTIINSLGNQIPLEEHDISNLWAPYRLAQLLDYFGISNLKYNELENLKDCLQEKCFFQKLIRQESIRQKNNSIRSEEINDFKSILENIRSRDLHIGIIDDETNSG